MSYLSNPMQPTDLEKFLGQQIPIVNSLKIQVVQADNDKVELKAPLTPNRNHLGTAFGGSSYSMAVLACYAWLFNVLKDQNMDCHVVIKTGKIQYVAPVDGDFTAICNSPDSEELKRFLQTLQRRKKSQITLRSEIRTHSQSCCLFEGEFVAVF